MSSADGALLLDLSSLVGLPEQELEDRLGAPDTRREVGPECWLIYGRSGLNLRVRCASDGSENERKVRSWSVTWSEPKATLRGATEPLGLWPACGPDRAAAELDAPLARRGLGGSSGSPRHSMTAVLGSGGFRRIAVFDEPPEWT